MHIIQLLEFPCTFTYQTSQEHNNTKDPYHITSASLSWNPFIHFLHTLHSIPSPDIVTGWHILCLIYFLYNTSLNETRTEISTFLMSLHQALLPSPPQRVHQALSLARGPGTLPPSPLWAPELMIHLLHLRQPSLTTCYLCPESW